MKPLAEQDHYEVLEIPRGTPQPQIDRAYQLALATYGEDSLAGYSIFGEGDVAEIRQRIEAAYKVLGDAASRRAYDASRAAADEAPPPVAPAPVAAPPPRVPEPIEDFGEEEDSDGFDGARLRRSRLRRAFEIEDVARVTKVNPAYLRCLEEERFSELPARVYVRGFVMAYASCVGLEPRAVTASFLQRFDQAQNRDKRRVSRGG
jgi:curved DNA-binding protein CbpA